LATKEALTMNRNALRSLWLAGLVLAVASGLAVPLAAQPWGTFFGPEPQGTHGYVEIPHSPALNPTGGFTFEAWVFEQTIGGGEDCRSIAGKNEGQAWWVAYCTIGGKRVLRSALKGDPSVRDGGEIPPNQWVHIAVTFNGSKRRHYVDGELVAEFSESGPLTTSASPMRILSDSAFQVTLQGFIRQVRLWNVARSLNQLRAWINKDITTAQDGLIGVWPLDGTAVDVVGPHDGTLSGSGAFHGYAASNTCNPSANTVCFDGRFSVSVTWRTNAGATGLGTVVPGFSSDSANFWFFSASNWELLVKTVNGCGLNNRHWIFYAPVTDVHYKIFVYDDDEDVIRVFLGYQGLTDGDTNTDAFNTCP
jgi:hypothetical protein